MLLRINDVFEKKPCTNSDVQNMAQKNFVIDYILPLKKSFRKKEVLKNRASKKKSIINFQENGRFSISFSSNKKNQNKPEKMIFHQNYYYPKTKSNSINPRSISLLLSPYHYLLLLFFV